MELYINVDFNELNKISLTNSKHDEIIEEVVQINTVSQNELLKNAILRSDPEKYTIVLFSSIITLLNPEQVTDYVEQIVKNIEFDVFYLMKYSDDIKGHDDFKILGNIQTMKVTSPHGIEALILSPNGKLLLKDNLETKDGRGIDYVMNAMCSKMKCYSSDPCIFNFDLKKRKNDYELMKGVSYTEAIHSMKPPVLTKKNTSQTNIYWFILVIIFIIFIAGALVTLTDDKKTNDSKPGQDPLLIHTPYNPTGQIETYGN